LTHDYTVLHLFAGIGGAALGFQEAAGEWKGISGRFYTLAGIDCDQEACQDFEALTGAPAVCMDLFSREDYVLFHGKQPPADWKEATPEDIGKATGLISPDMVFLSPPCKGFSGLLPSEKSKSEKYQALNRLVVRGLTLTLDAFQDDLPKVILLENVPRITSRGAGLLKQVKRLLSRHGYVFHEGYHDCGEIGGLGQHRKRYLLIARLENKMPSFIYRPPQRNLLTIGDVIGPLPMPDESGMGPMHRLPRLQWKTWVRLALIPAGGDWRDLERGGKEWFDNSYRIIPWEETAGTVTSGHSPSCGAVSVADPRLNPRGNRRSNSHLVRPWNGPAYTVTGEDTIGSGAQSIADPRTGFKDSTHHAIYRVSKWEEPSNTVTGAMRPNNGALVIDDPRVPEWRNGWKLSGAVGRINKWDSPTDVVLGTAHIRGNGAVAVADPRLNCRPRNGTMGVQAWDKPSNTVIGAGDVHAGSAAVADPRIPKDNERPDPPPVIIALDGTWHRPLTTLELAALQGFPVMMPDGRPLVLAGKSDSRWRERIGNAVPPPAARAMGEQVLIALLQAEAGDWALGCTGIWVITDQPKGEIGFEDQSKLFGT
jgi:site-specific DNA-cytosine methylase